MAELARTLIPRILEYDSGASKTVAVTAAHSELRKDTS